MGGRELRSRVSFVVATGSDGGCCAGRWFMERGVDGEEAIVAAVFLWC